MCLSLLQLAFSPLLSVGIVQNHGLHLFILVFQLRQCVRNKHFIKDGDIPSSFNRDVQLAGGSIIIPCLFIHKIAPDVIPEASNPVELPRQVTPNNGGSKNTPFIEADIVGNGRVYGIRIISLP